jgi:hypothetical protein
MSKSGLFKKDTWRVRYITSVVLTILMILCFSMFANSAQITYGDVDGNGQVDSADYSLVKRFLLGLATFSHENGARAADVNGDNMINSNDSSLMGRYLLGVISEFPAASQQPTATPTLTPGTGNITYTLVRVDNPTVDQEDAYQKIQSAMDTAVSYYNTYTTITKSLWVSYEPSVSTADGNINGSIRFGSNRSYMNHITAMHEIGHTVGVGTSGKWRQVVVNGIYTGTYATEELKTITGNRESVLKGDGAHFWPYGLNYTSEVKTDADLVNHCKIVNAMKKDGM